MTVTIKVQEVEVTEDMERKPGVEEAFLNGKQAPVVTITRRSTFPRGRSVGFIYRVLSDRKLVVATAKHVLLPERNPQAYEFALFDRSADLNIEEWFLFPHGADDIVFLVATAVPGFNPVSFGRPEDEMWLPATVYNAKNTLGETRYPISLFAQKAGMRIYEDRVFHLDEEHPRELVKADDTERIAELRQRGYSELRLAQLYTRPGFSGSPIWDDEWNLYGMGSGGTDGASERGDQIIYYPSSYLDKVWSELAISAH
ncbi:MAG TPA: trypsin-like peptidase domain-containing protein [Candidatus Paceibacterota bacterium]|jgi:hypothetical protein